MGRHCGDCVGQRDGSLVYLWVERDPGIAGRKPGHEMLPPDEKVLPGQPPSLL